MCWGRSSSHVFQMSPPVWGSLLVGSGDLPVIISSRLHVLGWNAMSGGRRFERAGGRLGDLMVLVSAAAADTDGADQVAVDLERHAAAEDDHVQRPDDAVKQGGIVLDHRIPGAAWHAQADRGFGLALSRRGV